ncbi:hypothetical protein B0H14DRAFT_2567812 [Mycena olivaceomarginata]|nr:hypothetical protein B0H14DRAFT_2567812 [Mycena olivaceomarginata]
MFGWGMVNSLSSEANSFQVRESTNLATRKENKATLEDNWRHAEYLGNSTATYTDPWSPADITQNPNGGMFVRTKSCKAERTFSFSSQAPWLLEGQKDPKAVRKAGVKVTKDDQKTIVYTVKNNFIGYATAYYGYVQQAHHVMHLAKVMSSIRKIRHTSSYIPIEINIAVDDGLDDSSSTQLKPRDVPLSRPSMPGDMEWRPRVVQNSGDSARQRDACTNSKAAAGDACRGRGYTEQKRNTMNTTKYTRTHVAHRPPGDWSLEIASAPGN